ncbi:protein translocase subunit SecD [Pleionea litopenaei]|uniref:Protein translocase subunit SecD n=1 Tax=Pleionea litopenaei TaxID=3070815 RepID=A0AA51X7Y2_9GAMM|nr:protein translocase subunit SecD [Pleionea sp. HL-JVS1]WMS87580.1 protein translocase subunit SecD [Pleionea sp. HL-JVS1]
MILGQPRHAPINTFPTWKYVMVLSIIFIGVLLALPNMYGEDFAVQISNKNGEPVSQELLDSIAKKVSDADVTVKSTELERGRGLIRLTSQEDQDLAKTAAYQFLNNHSDKNVSDDIVIAANLAPATPSWLANMGLRPMKLGLDLRGGVHFLLEVDLDDLFRREFEGLTSTIKTTLYEEDIHYQGVSNANTDSVVATFENVELQESAFAKLNPLLPEYEITEREVDGAHQLIFKMTEQKTREIRDIAVKKNITTLSNRINEIGVAEPLIQRSGSNRIIVQLPGIQDTAIARSIIGDTRTLEFRMVNEKVSLSQAMSGRVPYDSELIQESDGTSVLVYKDVLLDGEHVTGAKSDRDERGLPQISIRLDGTGGSIMANETGSRIGQRMAIILTEVSPIFKKDESGDFVKNDRGELIKVDEKIKKEAVSVATIQSTLSSSFRITGTFTPEYTSNLVLILKSGSLKAPIYIIEDSTVGPSLGQENIEKGTFSIFIGFILVLAFMLLRYRMFGLFANIALVCNLILIVGMMSMIGAVLTLPGMAGIVLTVGMAVDANVLIFERIREELKAGSAPAQAIHKGYDAALSTIADANVTTAIAALILFAVGTGPIKGFAITLLFGILTSMFTAIVGSRAMVNATYGGKAVKKIAI